MLFTLAPLFLGLSAWGLNLYLCIFQKPRILSAISWLLCACALWFPIAAWARWAAGEDVAALLDCAHAYVLCATILLAVNLLLTGIVWLRSIKK